MGGAWSSGGGGAHYGGWVFMYCVCVYDTVGWGGGGMCATIGCGRETIRDVCVCSIA